MKRQCILEGRQPPRISAVFGEAMLRMLMGEADVMRCQRLKLLALTERPNIDIRILPFTAGGHPGLDSAFTILGVGPGAPLEIVTVHSLTRSWYVDEPPDVERYSQAFERLRELALPEIDSRVLIERIVSET